MRGVTATAALLMLASCGLPQAPTARLPSDAVVGVGDPTRAAILGTAYAFATPESLAGHPAYAARAAAQVEYLATEIPNGPRWYQFNPAVGMELQKARGELRATLGISPDATPQMVVDSLYGASRALSVGHTTEARGLLGQPLFTDASVTLARLDNLPALPRTQTATALAQQELNRVDQEGRFSGGNGGSDRP
jgi:hypothetical protein